MQDKKVVPEDLPPMGDHWYQGFKERFPFLSLRAASSLTSTRMAAVNKFVLTFFFKLYQEALVMCGWTQDTLPSNSHIQVWNMDESFVDLSKRVYHRKVIAGVGSKERLPTRQHIQRAHHHHRLCQQPWNDHPTRAALQGSSVSIRHHCSCSCFRST